MITLASKGSKWLQMFWKTIYQYELPGLKLFIVFGQIDCVHRLAVKYLPKTEAK